MKASEIIETARVKMEAEVSQACQNFEAATGFPVDEINLDRRHMSDGSAEYRAVSSIITYTRPKYPQSW